jgi:signal transduction histidine kinase
MLLIVRHTVRSEIERQVQESTAASVSTFERVERQRELELSRTAALLAELPTLKALMTTEHAPTIQDASQTFWEISGSDLLLLANNEGRVRGLHMKNAGWQPILAERNLKRSLEQGEDAAWWFAEGQLYRVFLRSISAGPDVRRTQLGILAIGYRVDTSVAEQLSLVSGSRIALETGGQLIASTLSSAEEKDLVQHIAQGDLPETAAREVTLGSRPYQAASVLVYGGPPAPVKCYVLFSLERPYDFIQRLDKRIYILSILAVILAALFLSVFSATITRPLDSLVSGVRALAAGDFTYSIAPRGSAEVAELSQAFSKMRDELLAWQKRWIASERIAALGRAASSISHDLRHHLAAVVANAEFLYEADKLKMDRNEVYKEIRIASDQMVDLLDALRELAREDGAIMPVQGALDQTVRRAVETVLARPEFRSRKISVLTEGEMNGKFDPRKIERALFNLVLNACEATANVQGRIIIDVHSSGDTFEIRVRDNGPGVPPSVQSTLFDPFVSSGKPNGTGLGLAIVKKIVHEHAGSVILEHSSPGGTVFLVRLARSSEPVAAAAQPAAS